VAVVGMVVLRTAEAPPVLALSMRGRCRAAGSVGVAEIDKALGKSITRRSGFCSSPWSGLDGRIPPTASERTVALARQDHNAAQRRPTPPNAAQRRPTPPNLRPRGSLDVEPPHCGRGY